MNYQFKEKVMNGLLFNYKTNGGYRSIFKGVPISEYEEVKQFIDFTKYFVMFRGPRPNVNQASTRKCDAKAFDVYQRVDYQVRNLRIEREAFNRGVNWANNRSH